MNTETSGQTFLDLRSQIGAWLPQGKLLYSLAITVFSMAEHWWLFRGESLGTALALGFCSEVLGGGTGASLPSSKA